MASSAFLAIKCLFSLVEQFQKSFFKATNIIRNFMYVDDLLFGTSLLEEAIQLTKDIYISVWNYTSGLLTTREYLRTSKDPLTIINLLITW